MTCSRRDFLTAAAATTAVLAVDAQSIPAWTRLRGHAFGTTWRISLPGDSHRDQIRRVVDDVFSQVDATMSPYRTDSSLSRFNALQSTHPREVPNEVCAVVASSLEIAELTSGAFDPAVGPLVGRFGFGPIRSPAAGSFREFSVSGGALEKRDPGICLDLCGIAKGYALDCVVASLGRLGLRDFLVELGGEVCAVGVHPSGRAWQIGIERPQPGMPAIQRVVVLENMSLATSGDSTNFYQVGAQRYSHIIDPKTRRPVNHALASVSVLAPQAMLADGLATALMVLGPVRGPELASSENISALFIRREQSRLYETMTGHFESAILA